MTWPVGRLAAKCRGQMRLLWNDPEEFARNLQQFTRPGLFQARLLDIPDIQALRVQACDGLPRTLNILLPSIARLGMTGGPNTVLGIGCHLAQAGVPVRFVSCDRALEGDLDWFWTHLAQLTGIPGRPDLASVHDGRETLQIGRDDLFLASFWTTAHQAAAALPQTRAKSFLYLIQDFEPGFYPWSTRYAMALETYGLPFRAVINEAMLADYLFDTRVGNFADLSFRAACVTFEPAVDRRIFKPAMPSGVDTRPKRLLVYARPTNPRNLLGIAVAALRQAVANEAFAGAWEFAAVGARGSLNEVPLGMGRVLKEAPWRDYATYATLLQTSDILLCPMLSPHTSYPVLEMAACGGISLTNSFATKTAERLAAISPRILTAEPTVRGFAAGLVRAAELSASARNCAAPLALPATWEESFGAVESLVHEMLFQRVSHSGDTVEGHVSWLSRGGDVAADRQLPGA